MPMVTYKADVPAAARIVSDYGIKVIEKALTAAGMSAGVITSTLRLPDEQAEIMYRNAKANLTGQYKLYGNSGDQVLTVYKTNKARPKDEVVALMKAKIEELARQGAAGLQPCHHRREICQPQHHRHRAQQHHRGRRHDLQQGQADRSVPQAGERRLHQEVSSTKRPRRTNAGISRSSPTPRPSRDRRGAARRSGPALGVVLCLLALEAHAQDCTIDNVDLSGALKAMPDVLAVQSLEPARSRQRRTGAAPARRLCGRDDAGAGAAELPDAQSARHPVVARVHAQRDRLAPAGHGSRHDSGLDALFRPIRPCRRRDRRAEIAGIHLDEGIRRPVQLSARTTGSPPRTRAARPSPPSCRPIPPPRNMAASCRST